MYRRAAGIGLDIGSRKIKLVQLKRKGKVWHLLKFGSIFTPTGLVESGNIFNPEQLGEEMAGLVNKLGLKGQRVVSAVAGQQVYTRSLFLPRMNLRESRKAAIYQAVTFLPIPAEEAAIDIFPLRDIEDEEGPQREMLFVAVPRLQVENLNAACRIAGLKLIALEIEPFSINRIILPSGEPEIKAYLHLGASCCSLAVFDGETLLFYRVMSSFYQNIRTILEEDQAGFKQIKPGAESQIELIIKDFISKIVRSLEYFNTQYHKARIKQIWLSGGGTSLTGLDEILAAESGCKVEKAFILPQFILPPPAWDEISKRELNYDFLLALGLACRKVI